jgi:hypothetical protein
LDRCPGKPVVSVQGFQPALNVEGFDVVCDFFTPSGDEVGANDMLGVKHGAFRFRPQRIRPKVICEVILREFVEPNAGIG